MELFNYYTKRGKIRKLEGNIKFSQVNILNIENLIKLHYKQILNSSLLIDWFIYNRVLTTVLVLSKIFLKLKWK